MNLFCVFFHIMYLDLIHSPSICIQSPHNKTKFKRKNEENKMRGKGGKDLKILPWKLFTLIVVFWLMLQGMSESLFSQWTSGWAAPGQPVSLFVSLRLPWHSAWPCFLIIRRSLQGLWCLLAPGLCVWLLSVHSSHVAWSGILAGVPLWARIRIPCPAWLCCDYCRFKPGLDYLLLLEGGCHRLKNLGGHSLYPSPI